MRKDLTDITFLLDRTGSMATIKSDVIGGFNEFLQQQKDAEGDAVLTLVQFDSINHHEVIRSTAPVEEVEPMKPDDFHPRSSTPLLDALGETIVATGQRLNAMKEEDRPELVVFVVYTDGYENASREYTKSQVKMMIEHQQNTFNWQFVFIGADIDAIAQGASIGTQSAQTLSSGKDKVRETMAMTGQNIASYRSSKVAASLNYSDEQRAESK